MFSKQSLCLMAMLMASAVFTAIDAQSVGSTIAVPSSPAPPASSSAAPPASSAAPVSSTAAPPASSAAVSTTARATTAARATSAAPPASSPAVSASSPSTSAAPATTAAGPPGGSSGGTGATGATGSSVAPLVCDSTAIEAVWTGGSKSPGLAACKTDSKSNKALKKACSAIKKACKKAKKAGKKVTKCIDKLTTTVCALPYKYKLTSEADTLALYSIELGTWGSFGKFCRCQNVTASQAVQPYPIPYQ